MKGEHIAKYAKSLGAGSEEYNKKFSQYTAQVLLQKKSLSTSQKLRLTLLLYLRGAKLPEEGSCQ